MSSGVQDRQTDSLLISRQTSWWRCVQHGAIFEQDRHGYYCPICIGEKVYPRPHSFFAGRTSDEPLLNPNDYDAQRLLFLRDQY